MTEITRLLQPDRPAALPTTTLPTDELTGLLVASDRLTRLVEFLGVTYLETSFCRRHNSTGPDPWVMGYSIETEHRGCYRFVELASGPEWEETLDAGLAAWDEECAAYREQEAESLSP